MRRLNNNLYNGNGEEAMLNQSNANSAMVDPAAYPPMAGEGARPESLFDIAWRGRWIILTTAVLGLTAGFVYLRQATPLYTSEARIYVEQSGPKIISSMEEGVMTQSKNYLYTQAELITSTPVLSTALKLPDVKGLRTFAEVSNATGFLKKAVSATVGSKDDIINVSLETPYPAESAAIVNAVVESYVTFHAQTKRTTASEVLKILQKEKEKRGAELSERLKAMMDFKTRNEALAFETGAGNVILAELQGLSDALNQSRLATVKARSLYECARDMTGEPEKLSQFLRGQQSGVVITGGGKRGELETQLDALKRRYADRRRTLGPDHPGLEAVRTEMAEVQQRLDRLDAETVQAQLAAAESQYLAAQKEQEQIEAYYDDLRKGVLALNEQIATYTILQSEYEQTRKLCDILDDRIKELNVTEDVGALNITILETAHPSNRPSSPQRARVMGMALMLGLMAGGGLSLARSWLDQRFRSADEMTAILGLPLLGIVPTMRKRESMGVHALKTHFDSSSAPAEACRTIRTAVFFGVPKDKARTLLITSPVAGDGKTTLACNLAIAMAQAGQRVLIIDADFRKPMQHRVFNIPREPGVSSVIAGQEDLDRCISGSIVKGLDVMPCGPDVPNPSELLNSERFAEIIEELADRYDRVVIDAPPVIPVTDACILGAIADVTLLVLRADKSTRKASLQARERLAGLGARVLGVVVNDVSQRHGRYSYYYYYGYKYYGKDDNGQRKRRKKHRSKQEPAVAAADRGVTDMT